MEEMATSWLYLTMECRDAPAERPEQKPTQERHGSTANSAAFGSAAAASQPDLVIHVGDYLYRESECPKNMGCSGSPRGDNKGDAWYADFFEPASKLLAAAPWIMTRGNHEICSRAGRGYFLFLDPALATGKVPSCTDNVSADCLLERSGFELPVTITHRSDQPAAAARPVAQTAATEPEAASGMRG